MTDTPLLRPKQIDQLAFYIANPKCLDLSDPGTGKTPPCCVYAYYMWDRGQRKTLWSMPKSLLKKNLTEMVRFTEFQVTNPAKYTPGDDVVIMKTDRATLTKNWTGPTIQSTRRVATWPLRDGRRTHEIAEASQTPITFAYVHPKTGHLTELRTGKSAIVDPQAVRRLEVVNPIFKPDGVTPVKEWVDVPEVFKDLIEAAAQDGAKVFICTFAFMSAHWERLLKAAPEIDLLLVDELHMPGGYSTPTSKATESFYWVNRHVSRFVGMTGTLINGRLDSAYAAISVIESRYYGSLQGFMFEHAAVVDDYGRVVVWKNEEKLQKILARHSIRRTFEEVYGEEDVVFFTEYVDMEEKVRAKYDEFEEQALLELDDGRVLDGTMAGVNQIRCRQLFSHPETMALGKIEQWTPKDERLQIHLAEGQKTLIFASLVPEQERIVRLCESMGLRVGLINGSVSAAQRVKIDEAAQRGELDVIVASGPTVAVGYNWEFMDLVIFASIDFMDTNILQAYRRASRGSRTKQLRVIFLRYADCDVEDRMYAINLAKSQLANRVDATRPVLQFTSGLSGPPTL